MKREPVITSATISAALGAIITLAIAFNAPITEAQQTAILGLVTPLFTIAAAIWARSKVTPTNNSTGYIGTTNN